MPQNAAMIKHCGRPALGSLEPISGKRPSKQGKQARQVTLSTWAELMKKTYVPPKPYEIKLSGFLTALERHCAFN